MPLEPMRNQYRAVSYKNNKYMSYESEQIEFQKELEQIKARYEALDKYFELHPDEKKKGWGANSFGDYTRMQYEQILQRKYNDYDIYGWSTLYLEYKVCKYRKNELEYNLKESKTHRKISKTVDYIGSITPQHVSGRIYKVENGDGCGKFCLWFLIIDAFIIFLYWIISGGH